MCKNVCATWETGLPFWHTTVGGWAGTFRLDEKRARHINMHHHKHTTHTHTQVVYSMYQKNFWVCLDCQLFDFCWFFDLTIRFPCAALTEQDWQVCQVFFFWGILYYMNPRPHTAGLDALRRDFPPPLIEEPRLEEEEEGEEDFFFGGPKIWGLLLHFFPPPPPLLSSINISVDLFWGQEAPWKKWVHAHHYILDGSSHLWRSLAKNNLLVLTRQARILAE